MGWTSTDAKYYKKNGKVDVKAECDDMFIDECKVLKSSMVGNTYFAAVYYEGKVIAMITETSTKVDDQGFNFHYKGFSEACGSYNYNCPKGILDLLTPTESKWANEWRQKCYERLAKKRNPDSLSKLKVGAVIEFTCPFDCNAGDKGDVIRLTKHENWKPYAKRRSYRWDDGQYKWATTMIPDDYVVINR